MEDFRISTTWRRHRKRKRLRKLLDADGVLALEDLWSFAAEMRTDGILTNMTALDMADEVDYPGDAEAMLKAFVDLRLMDSPDDECSHYRFHDWAEHQRWIVGHQKRSERARQAALQKHYGNQGSALPTACGGHAAGMPTACGGHAPSPSPSPSPSPFPDPNIKYPSCAASKTGRKRKKATNRPKKKIPHPGAEHLKELQELSDHHADLFGRDKVKIQLNDHVRRIVKVLLKYGLEGCRLIQAGHKDTTEKIKFMGWEFAYPMLRDGKKKFVTKPDWSWIQTHHAAGKKKNRPEDESFA